MLQDTKSQLPRRAILAQLGLISSKDLAQAVKTIAILEIDTLTKDTKREADREHEQTRAVRFSDIFTSPTLDLSCVSYKHSVFEWTKEIYLVDIK